MKNLTFTAQPISPFIENCLFSDDFRKCKSVGSNAQVFLFLAEILGWKNFSFVAPEIDRVTEDINDWVFSGKVDGLVSFSYPNVEDFERAEVKTTCRTCFLFLSKCRRF